MGLFNDVEDKEKRGELSELITHYSEEFKVIFTRLAKYRDIPGHVLYDDRGASHVIKSKKDLYKYLNQEIMELDLAVMEILDEL